MHTARQAASATRSAAWRIVESWPAPLSGEAKLCWLLLAELRAACGGETIRVAAAELSLRQGRGERRAHDWLRQLERAGLIEIVDRQRGSYVVWLAEPATAARAKRGPHDPQRTLWADEEESASIDDASPTSAAVVGMIAPRSDSSMSARESDSSMSAPPRSDSERPLSARLRATGRIDGPAADRAAATGGYGVTSAEVSHPPIGGCHIRRSVTSADSDAYASKSKKYQASASASGSRVEVRSSLDAETRSQRSADAAPHPPKSIGELLAGRPGGEAASTQQRAERALEIADYLARRVADERFQRGPRLKIAWAVADGRVPERQLEDVLARMDAEARVRGAYFVRAMQRIFSERSIEWYEGERR